jgi:hypothetical protein
VHLTTSLAFWNVRPHAPHLLGIVTRSTLTMHCHTRHTYWALSHATHLLCIVTRDTLTGHCHTRHTYWALSHATHLLGIVTRDTLTRHCHTRHTYWALSHATHLLGIVTRDTLTRHCHTRHESSSGGQYALRKQSTSFLRVLMRVESKARLSCVVHRSHVKIPCLTQIS